VGFVGAFLVVLFGAGFEVVVLLGVSAAIAPAGVVDTLAVSAGGIVAAAVSAAYSSFLAQPVTTATKAIAAITARPLNSILTYLLIL
jgi:hypothetical protein